MSWQDIALSVGQVIFVIFLFPSILSKDKPALATSLITALVLYAFALIDLTISLYVTSITVAATAAGWSILAYQKDMIDRRKG